jgi:FKBP-type peptidyl-prolyl cis-trans isomerase
MPRFHPLVLVALAATAAAAAADPDPVEFNVDVYEGPKECAEDQKVKSGDYLKMHYTGFIHESSETGEPGKQFDSSRDRGDTLDFQVGIGSVIRGWDTGLVGLCKGAKATLVLPPDYGYGAEGAGDVIPGGATLQFDIGT